MRRENKFRTENMHINVERGLNHDYIKSPSIRSARAVVTCRRAVLGAVTAGGVVPIFQRKVTFFPSDIADNCEPAEAQTTLPDSRKNSSGSAYRRGCAKMR